MTPKTFRMMTISTAISQLYGYIYCMLLSNTLVGMPLFGGALYLCGRSVMVFASLYGKKSRRYLSAYARRWGIVLVAGLMIITYGLTALYPATLDNPRTWIVFALTFLCMIADGMTSRIFRITSSRDNVLASRIWLVSLLLQILLILAGSAILWLSLGWDDSYPLIGGYAVLVLVRSYIAQRLYQAWKQKPARNDLEQPVQNMESIRVYRSYEWINVLLLAAIELVVIMMYTLLTAQSSNIIPSLMIAVLCTIAACEAGTLYLQRSKTPKSSDPTWMLCAGLVLLTLGAVIGGRMLRAGEANDVRTYLCLALSSVGGTIGMTGLYRIEELMTDVIRLKGGTVSNAYWHMRITNWESSRLLGDTMALIGLTVICFATGKDLPHNTAQIAARFQPMMIIPILLVALGALISALRFPLSSHYIEKLRNLLQLREAGSENLALQRQVHHVLEERYRQPYLSHFLIALLRPFYRHSLVHAEHIRQDSDNPLVFVCNHGELYGPIVCNLYIPVPIRTWTYAMMMFDKRDVTKYLFDNTFVRQTQWPMFLRKLLARFFGWLSVTVMDQLENIPVYRDSPMKLRETVRMSIEAMEAGDNLLIFPEDPHKKYELEGIGSISPGFVMLAAAYWKKTGKKLRILPMYANKNARTICFGEEIQFHPEIPFADEQARIVRETEEQIRGMAAIKNGKENHHAK